MEKQNKIGLTIVAVVAICYGIYLGINSLFLAENFNVQKPLEKCSVLLKTESNPKRLSAFLDSETIKDYVIKPITIDESSAPAELSKREKLQICVNDVVGKLKSLTSESS